METVLMFFLLRPFIKTSMKGRSRSPLSLKGTSRSGGPIASGVKSLMRYRFQCTGVTLLEAAGYDSTLQLMQSASTGYKTHSTLRHILLRNKVSGDASNVLPKRLISVWTN